MQENYKILGVSENATNEEIEKAYRELKARLREERFMEGEVGNEAAKKLTQVETAYAEIKAVREQTKSAEDHVYDFSEVEAFLKDGKINEAQDKLDNYNDRNAEWHYLQSVIFYKKNWTNESKKQLEIAIQMDSSNEKYRSAYNKLREKIEYDKKKAEAPQQEAQQQAQPEYDADRQMGGGLCEQCATCCACNMLFNCCMNACCGCR